MMARCKLNPCCGATMPGKCEPPPQIKPNEGWEAYEQRVAALAKPASSPAGGDVRDYPARIWVERDEETNEKRWFSIAGSGVEYVRAGTREAEPAAWRAVLAERRRQVEAEGWTPEHDDQHTDGEMADAAALYASLRVRHITGFATWPWDAKWWKPKDRRSDLVRAGALILAEIERLDRAALSQSTSAGRVGE